ncbi:hypothetical protein [Desulfitibacter alkalitolerans]|uniref:hypothetical protein n=1 Tax=Desulfitibacter alkalitolerans TaxID=264641 RepID=UPI000487063B|nr:hypothetical protein [Desulfitibacter alkalitolerans]
MAFIIAGLMASLMAWVFDRYIFSKEGLKGVVFFGPFAEELFKTGLALIFNTSIILTHIVFGFAEAVMDYKNTKKSLGAMVSLVSHTILGIITYGLFILLGSIYIALLIAAIVHISWNKFVMDIVLQKL